MVLPIPGLHGAHLRRDLVERFGRRRLSGALNNGEVRPLWTGVVVEAARQLDPLTRAAAALLSTGPHAVLTDVTAAFVHGCTSVDTVGTHVLLPYGYDNRSRAGLVVHHGGFFADDVQEVAGLRVLALYRVLADILCTARPSDALAVTDEALRGADGAHEQLRRRVAATMRTRQDPRGTVRGAGLLDLASPRAESPPESWLRLLLVQRGFPLPEVNWSIQAPDGREIYRVDLAWPGLRIALEYDGYDAHAGREVQDEARAEDLRRRGWIVVRADRHDLSNPTRLTSELRAAFARRGYPW